MKVYVLFLLFGLMTKSEAMEKKDFIIIGHRGAKGLAPENTLRAFSTAIKNKVDAVELDVFCCKSGELVVIHDNELNMTTNGKGLVVDHTLKQLKMLRTKNKRETIPTLDEVLHLIDKRVVVNIEIKGENVAEPLSKLLMKYVADQGWSYNNFLVTSFDHPQIKKFTHLCPQAHIGLLYLGTPLNYAHDAQLLKAQCIVLFDGILRQEFVDDAHQRGLKVYVYTVNEKKRVRRLLQQGVDGIVTDYPDRFRNRRSKKLPYKA